MKIINLLPKDAQRELRLETISGQLLSFWGWTLLTLGVVFVVSLATTFYLNERINQNNVDIANKRQSLNTASTKQVEQEVSTLNNQINLINSLQSDHYYWSKVLVELSYLTDSNTKLTQVLTDRQTGKVQVYGQATNRASVLAFWAAVNKTGMFKGINFPLTNLEKDVNPTFTFTFYVNPDDLKQP